MPPPDPDSDREDRVDSAIAEYLQAAESGRPPDREAFLRSHPEIAQELTEFLDDREHFTRLASDIAPRAPGDACDSPRAGDSSTRAIESGIAVPGELPCRIGDYELLEEIARGGMGIVYRARQISLHRHVAVKTILTGRLASSTDVSRFRSEANAAARLDHPNIVPIYEVGEHDGQPFFSMRLVEGGNLTTHGDRYRHDPRAAARLLAVLAEAIHHAHQRGILHRDLKPRNILLDTDGTPQITDFGLAKLLEADGSLTQSGAVLGTASYMPPEQARGDGALTTAGDVYGLGAIFYELLTGQPPFRGATPAETVVQVLEREPASPRAIQSTIDRDLETICLKCLEKEPSQRYGSARALAVDLRHWLEGRPIEARPVGSMERAWRVCCRNPAMTSVVAAALGIIVFLTGFYIDGLNARNRETEEALDEARIAGNKALMAQEETTDALARSRFEEARALAVAGPPGRRWRILDLIADVESLRTRSRFEESLANVHGSRSVLPGRNQLRSEAVAASLLADARIRWQMDVVRTQPGLSCDARRAISFHADGADNFVAVTDLENGAVLTRVEDSSLRGATAFGLAPSARSAVAFDATTRELLLLDMDAGKVQQTLPWPRRDTPDGPTPLAPRFVWSSEIVFSPDGGQLAVVGRSPTEQTLMLWRLDSVDTPRALITIPENTDHGPPIFLPDGTKLAYVTGPDTVTVWNMVDPEETEEIRSPVPLAGQIAVDRAGRRLALAASGDAPGTGTIVIWDLVGQRDVTRITTDFSLKAAPLALHPTRDYLAAGTTDGRIFIVDPIREQEVLALPGAHNGRVVHLRWSPDGDDLISWGLDLPGRSDGMLVCREFGMPPTSDLVVGSDDASFAASRDGARIAVAYNDGRLELHDREPGKIAFGLANAPLRSVQGLAFSPDSRLLAATDDYSVVVWDLTAGDPIARLDETAGLQGLLAAIAFTPQQECLAVEFASGSQLTVWDVLKTQRRCSFDVSREIQTILLSPDTVCVVTVADSLRQSSKVTTFDVDSGERLSERDLSTSPLGPILCSPDGRWLAYGSRREDDPLQTQLGLLPATLDVVVVPMVADGSKQTITGPSAVDHRACAFSLDGRFLAVGYRDGSLTLWDPHSRESLFHVHYRSTPITQVAFANDGRSLLVADAATIGIIDLAKFQQDLAGIGLAW